MDESARRSDRIGARRVLTKKAEKELNSRSAYTAIARVKPGDPSAFQLEVGRDF
jgi:hypothetical protein